MKFRLSTYLLLAIIVFLSFFLRVYKITSIPPSLSWDEVSIGYNAYSILKTGKDEHGKFLPLDTFAAYGDYKPPVAIYVTVPFVALLGLNELSVRLPSTLFGSATVFLVYFLVLELFAKDKNRKNIALLSSLLLGISPWHLNISRAGFEANIALFFVVLGIYLFLRALKNSKLWLVTFLPFVVAIYTFNSSRYFVPFIGLFLFLTHWKSVRKSVKTIAIGCIIAAFFMVPITPHLLSKEARLRFEEVNIFSDPGPVLLSNQRIAVAGNTWWAKIINNRRVYYFQSFAKHYLDHFDPQYLFIKGDGNPKFSIQDVGQFYLIEAPFLFAGMIALLYIYPSVGIFLFAWLLLSIVPAATARETPHALRTLNSLPTWQIFIAFGTIFISTHLKGFMRNAFVIVCIVLWSLNFVYYLHTYYVHYPFEYSREWEYGYKDSFAVAEKLKGQYEHIVVSESIGRPYAYALFYGKYDPTFFWNTKKDYFDAAGFYHVDQFGKYQFVSRGPETFDSKSLYILPPEQKPASATEVTTITLLNGEAVYSIFHL
jgi:4-amino-4-deoxy-L-arabinose transferase-like glycosyltransferase